jgi:methionyl-tRNA synthetase
MDHISTPPFPSFYVTTAIPYVNAPPHVGFAYETLLADVLARYHRLCGSEVRFQSGTDDNSLKNVRAAEREGIETAALVARFSSAFRDLQASLHLSYDDFVQTSVDPRHRAAATALWRACAASGDLYRRRYEGLYCVGCEQFYAASELRAGVCPEHGIPPEPVAEDNWFFRLSRYRDALLRLIEHGQILIAPETRRNEVLAFLAGGLEDISVSRARTRGRGWGIPVPDDPQQVIYVWFDALANYLSGLGWAAAADGPGPYQRFWAGGGQRVHVIGKGILRFHAVYWPAILLSAGLPLPTDLFVHGYLTVDGQKIGKSLGNAIDPAALVQRYGIDPVRHYLLRHLRPFSDGDFSETRLRKAHDTELADQLGNLVRRTIVLIQRNFDGAVPAPHDALPPDRDLRRQAAALAASLSTRLRRFAVDEALGDVFDLVSATNRYIEATAPFTLARDSGDSARRRLATVLHHAIEAVRISASALAPFLPGTSAAICAQLGHDPVTSGLPAALRWGGTPWRRPLSGGPILFVKTVTSQGAKRSASQ